MNKRLLQIMLASFLIIAIAMAIYYRDSINLELLQSWLNQAGWWAPVLFVLVYTIATVLFLPGSIFTLAGGVLFGPILGTVYNLVGATLGATLSFLIARYIASDYVSQRAAGKLKQLIKGVEAEGWRFVAFVRLVPLFPFNLLNYALGLTKIRFIEYIVATFIFIIPGSIAYTYLGFAGREAVSGGDDIINTVLIAIALLAVVTFLPRFVATLRRGPTIDTVELKRLIDNNETLVLDVRSQQEYLKDGHIEHAIHISLENLENQISTLNQDQSISIVSKTDRRSTKAANILSKHGYTKVCVVVEGMAGWAKHQYPVVG